MRNDIIFLALWNIIHFALGQVQSIDNKKIDDKMRCSLLQNIELGSFVDELERYFSAPATYN